MRRKPYTQIGIGRIPCTRCGNPSVYQWQVCADHRQYRGCCADCDIGLNAMVMEYMRIPQRRSKLRAYRRRVATEI